MYPRKRYFDEIVRTFESQGRVLPLLNDKYLAYDWADAKSMADRIRALQIPFACGSTVPLSWQRPPLNLPPAPQFDELLAVSYSDLEEHAYHAIEALQSVAERRGETGVAAVRYMEGEEVYKISPKLLEAALASARESAARRTDGSEAGSIPDPLPRRPTGIGSQSEQQDARLSGRRSTPQRVRSRAACFYISLYVHSHWGFMVQAFENLVLTKKRRCRSSEHCSPTASCSPDLNRAAKEEHGSIHRSLRSPIPGRASAAPLSTRSLTCRTCRSQAIRPPRLCEPWCNEPVPEVTCDVLIAGAGMGGIGAALAVSRHNQTACLTEETDWVGGQATAGGVSALDENKFIEICRRHAQVLRIPPWDSSGIRRAVQSRRLLRLRALFRAPRRCRCPRRMLKDAACPRVSAHPGHRRRSKRRPDRERPRLAVRQTAPHCASAPRMCWTRPKWAIFCRWRKSRTSSDRKRNPKPVSRMPPRNPTPRASRVSHIRSQSSAATARTTASPKPCRLRAPSSSASSSRCT